MTSVETRNIARDSLFLFADLSFEGQGAAVRVKVRNLSEGGMMAEAGCAVSRGERLSIDLRNVGGVRGRIAWVQGNRFGIAFDAPVDAKRVRSPVGVGETEAPRIARPDLSADMFSDEERRLRRI